MKLEPEQVEVVLWRYRQNQAVQEEEPDQPSDWSEIGSEISALTPPVVKSRANSIQITKSASKVDEVPLETNEEVQVVAGKDEELS